MVVGLALVCANLPFLNNRIFAVFSFPTYLLSKLSAQELAGLRADDNPAEQLTTNSQSDEEGDVVEAADPLALQFRKPFWLRLAELLLLYSLVGMFGFYLEAQQGNRFIQGWQFYATTLSLFIVFAFPGFVFQYLRRKHG